MIRGPTDCISSTQREALRQLRATTLDNNEGIDARSVKSGKAQRVTVKAHVLNEGAEAAPFFPVKKNRDAVARVQLDDLHGSSAAIARASVPRVAEQYRVGGI